MERSKLENISNTQLFYLLKNVIKLLDGFRDGDIEHPGFSHDCDSAATIVGLDLSFPIDENYIASTLKLNPDYDFDDLKPESHEDKMELVLQ